MTRERHHFIVSARALKGGRFTLDGTEAHHLSRVARLDVGDEIFLLDLQGNAHRASIEEINNGMVSGIIHETEKDYNESIPRLHLGIGILKGANMDMVVEKGTELGVNSITPLAMRYNVRRGFRRDRFERIALSALKQCGRGRVPTISDPIPFSEWCSRLSNKDAAVADSSASSVRVQEWLGNREGNVRDIWLTIGPEGGYHEDELKVISQNGLASVSLGPRRLRSETAALALLAICGAYFAERSVI